MRFEHRRTITGAAAADVDPRTSPGAVPDAALSKASLNLRSSDTILRRIILAAEGTAANTIIVSIYAQDDQGLDRQASMPDRQTQAEKDARRFYLVAAGVTVTVGELTEVLTNVPMPGTIYFRVTTAPAADGTLLAAFAA
jgi:hypothetical protein